MDNNELMRRIRYAIQVDDDECARLLALGGYSANAAEARTWRTREGEVGHDACPDEVLTAMLEGLVLDRRGPVSPDAAVPSAESVRIDNNRVLKQLRIALKLQTEDIVEMVSRGGGRLGKSELGALFRKPGTRNYRACGDQVLRWFLSGLAQSRE